MKRVIRNILAVALLIAFDSQAVSAQSEGTTPTDSASTQAVVPVKVAPDAALAKEKANVAKLIRENSQLKQENNELRNKVHDLQRDSQGLAAEKAALEEALAEAMPVVEAGINVNYNFSDVDFENAEIARLSESASTLNKLSPYSKIAKAKADTLSLLINLIGKYRQVSKFDTKPYSAELSKDVETAIFYILDNGGKLLNEARLAQMDSVYIKAGNYRTAVETFDSIIKDVDAAVGEYRNNGNADNLARNDTNDVLAKDVTKVSEIKRYSYLAELYDRYCAELNKSPRSLTEAIRQEIADMLKDATPAIDSEAAGDGSSDGDEGGEGGEADNEEGEGDSLED